MSSPLSQKVVRLLTRKSGGVCAIPACGKSLWTAGGAFIGKAAHIRGENPGSARYDAAFPVAQLNNVPNLMYVCANHHDEIDGDAHLWPVEKLLEIKSAHEEAIHQALRMAVAQVNFEQLTIVVGHLLAAPSPTNQVFSITVPDEKLVKNDLTTKEVRDHLVLGLAKLAEVQRFVRSQEAIDGTFAERLRAGFLVRYNALIQQGVSGDELFLELAMFAEAGQPGLLGQAAGLSVLAYLFHTCEVFDP